MNITITIPDQHVNRIVDGICATHGYYPDSGLTKGEFCRKVLKDFIIRATKEAEATAALQNAMNAVQAELDSIGVTAV